MNQSVIFLPYSIFSTLQQRRIDLNKLIELVNYPNSNSELGISMFTKAFMVQVNTLLNKNLFNKVNYDWHDFTTFRLLLTQTERKNLEDNVKTAFFQENYSELTPDNYTKFNSVDYTYISIEAKHALKEKYYEMFTLPGNVFLIVFQDGFVSHLTENKENYMRFLLNVLCTYMNFNKFDRDIFIRYLLFLDSQTDINYLKLGFSVFN